ncbi:MAG: aminopeptidase [Christensenellaceae bacterium]|nr:aminopeptidase [Christensenellaceae bacterium]MDD6927014.1 aminopeptidase [bacterium]MDY2850584.1 aminopeptidase [Christensenellaceae bacterium]
MKDSRIQKLAYNLVNYSCSLKKGEKILIEAFGIEPALVNACVEEARKVGAYPFVTLRDHSVQRAMLMNTDEEHMKLWAKYDSYIMEDMDAYLGIRGGNNSYELSDVPAANTGIFDRIYSHPVHHEIRVKKTKWCVLRYPNPSMAQLSGMSTEAFEDFYYDVCTLDYSKMDKAMDALKALMDKTDKVHLIAKETDLTFSIKGIGSEKCSGQKNIPDGEIYSAPVKDSVNGVITYNAPSINKGVKFENIRLEFKDGKIVKATGNYTEKLNEIFDTDEGARYVGEFAIGVNPYVTKPMGDILFDEKIAGSIHFTPGCCYDDCYNGNISSIHWDLVLIMTPEYGGGEIWFDDVLIRKDGMFVLDELKALNPENLK